MLNGAINPNEENRHGEAQQQAEQWLLEHRDRIIALLEARGAQ